MKIGLLIIATGKYDVFIQPLLDSVRTHFLKDHEVTMFVFSDKKIENDDIHLIYQEHLGWPDITLKRYHIFDKNREELAKMDYLFYCDADMLFVDVVGDEILPNGNGLMGVKHPGYYTGNRGTYETNIHSTACINSNEGDIYYAGGFNGGKSKEFLSMCKTLKNNINRDLENNIVAVWHDESHLNRYFFEHRPMTILSPSYCYPESWNLPFKRKLLALDKNHKEIRTLIENSKASIIENSRVLIIKTEKPESSIASDDPTRL